MILVGILSTDATLSDEPESKGFLLLYCGVAIVFHLPVAAVFALLAYAIKRCFRTAVVILYAFAILGMTASGVYFARWFISFPYVKYAPAVLYLLVFLPFLSQGVLASVKKDCQNVSLVGSAWAHAASLSLPAQRGNLLRPTLSHQALRQ